MRSEVFFERQEVARTCPDTKKMVPHPFKMGEKIPAQYHLGTIKMLHFSFEAETGVKCSLECSRQNIPFYVVHPKPNDWGMSLCALYKSRNEAGGTCQSYQRYLISLGRWKILQRY